VVERALRRLQEECKGKGDSRLCETLSPYLATERSDVSYGKLSELLGISESGCERQLHNCAAVIAGSSGRRWPRGGRSKGGEKRDPALVRHAHSAGRLNRS